MVLRKNIGSFPSTKKKTKPKQTNKNFFWKKKFWSKDLSAAANGLC